MTALAQTQPCSFPLTVEIMGGQAPAHGISANGMTVRLRGNSVAVKNVEPQSNSQVVVVLDNSFSMQGRARDSLLAMTKDLLEAIPANVKDVGLTTFGDVAIHARGRESALQAIGQMKGQTAYGRTRLLDSLEDSARYFQAGPRTLMVVITDGGDNHSREDVAHVKKNLLRRGIRVTLMITKMQADVPEEMTPADVIDIADMTGGTVIFMDLVHADPGRQVFVPGVMARLMGYLRVELDAPEVEGKLHVEVRDESGKKERNLNLHYPRELNCVR